MATAVKANGPAAGDVQFRCGRRPRSIFRIACRSFDARCSRTRTSLSLNIRDACAWRDQPSSGASN